MKKHAIVTGASRGIGRAIACELAKCDYDLTLVCHNNDQLLKALADELSKDHQISVSCFCGDLQDEGFVSELFSQITRLDVLVNNAGIAHIGLLQDMTLKQWSDILNTNLTSAFLTCRHAIPLMLQNKSGSIINISSMWGRVGASMEVAYSASKGGMNAFTMALAKELAPSGISVNAIAPGAVDTEMNNHLTAKELEALTADIPISRLATPEDIASAVSSIINAGPYLTGQVIGVDGGYI